MAPAFLELIPITEAALTGNLTLGSPLLTLVASPGGDVKISQAQAASGIGAPMLITAQAAATGSDAVVVSYYGRGAGHGWDRLY